MSEKYYVYKHTTPNDKVYIGITKHNPSIRWGKGGYGYRTQVIFYRAIQKYGWDNIKHEILFNSLTREEAEKKEIELIAQYKSDDRQFGYNVSSGGHALSDEGIERISKAQKGRHLSDETRERIRLANLGKKLDQRCKAILTNSRNVKVLQKQNGEVIREWKSVREASRILNIHSGSISECCKGKRKTAGGYCWEYAK